MPDQSDIQKLEMRIIELENELKQLRARREPEDITADELKAFRKVSEMLHADFGEFCGINDCARCLVMRCNIDPTVCRIVFCDIECTCGPCNLGRFTRGGGGRFGGLGG